MAKAKKLKRVAKVTVPDYSENNAIGLALGILLAAMHAVWLIMVFVGVAEDLMNWVLGLHMVKLSYSITIFSSGKALGLLILTFVVGYIIGWALAALLKMAREKK